MKKPKKHGNRYPWKQWFARTRFKLVRGKHFPVTQRMSTFLQMIRNAARAGSGLDGVQHSVKLRPADDESYVIVELVKKGDSGADTKESVQNTQTQATPDTDTEGNYTSPDSDNPLSILP